MNKVAKRLILFLALIFLRLLLNSQDKGKIQECLSIIAQGNEDTLMVKACNDLATEFLGSDDEKAKMYANKALRLSIKLSNKYLQSWSLNLIGMSYDYLGKPDSALFNYQKAIKIKNVLQDNDGLGSVYMNIGVMYYYQNNTPKAIEYYTKSINYFYKVNNQKRIAGIFNNLGIIYRQEKKYISAIEMFEKAFDIKSKIKDTVGMANAFGNLGVVYQKMGNYRKAEQYHLKSMRLDSLTTNNYNLVSSYISLAELYFYIKKYDAVKNYLNKAIEKGDKINAIHYLDDAYLLYTKNDSVTKNDKMAYLHLKKYIYYNNEVLKTDRLKQMDKLETVFLVKEKENRINLLNATSQINELKIQQQKKQLLVFVIVSALLICLIIVILISYKRTQHQRRELHKKNTKIEEILNEKETLLKEIHHRVKNNLQIISSLLNLQSRYIKDDNALNAINESKERINAISLLHKEIYQNEVLKLIDTKAYFENLFTHLQNAFDPTKKCNLTIYIDELFLDIDSLLPLGLIANELITNAYKYGCANTNPQINFALTKNLKTVTMSVQDNGKGFNENFSFEKLNSLGLKLISLFANKLNAKVITENNSGACIKLIFSLK